MANTIGIDFGTTKTMVSYFNPATGRVELVRLGRDRDSIPTTVHVDESGDYLFGEDADDQIETDPEGYCRAFKLHLGEKESVLPRSGETAESLTARFLRHVKEECEQFVFHGEAIGGATITIPVSFSPARKVSLKRAAEAAGFASVSFLPEPEAAGTAFLRDNPADKFSRALVLDWGGGTLDIAIISRDDDGTIRADRHCAEGRDDVGGEEMDRGLFENLKYLWEQTFGTPLISSEENEPKLLRESEKVKIGLSRKDMVPFRQGKDKIDITRDQFKQIVEQLLQASVDLVNSALSKNKAQGYSGPDAILLIGGTCQSPIVRETMERHFPNLRVLSWHHSHEAVALGAMMRDTTPSGQENPSPSLDVAEAASEMDAIRGTFLRVLSWRHSYKAAELGAKMRDSPPLGSEKRPPSMDTAEAASEMDETYVGFHGENERHIPSNGDAAAADASMESKCINLLFPENETNSHPHNALLRLSKHLFDMGKKAAKKTWKLPFMEWLWSTNASYSVYKVSSAIAVILSLAGIVGGRDVLKIGGIICCVIFVPLVLVAAVLFFPTVLLFLLSGAVCLLRIILVFLSWISSLVSRCVRFV